MVEEKEGGIAPFLPSFLPYLHPTKNYITYKTYTINATFIIYK